MRQPTTFGDSRKGNLQQTLRRNVRDIDALDSIRPVCKHRFTTLQTAPFPARSPSGDRVGSNRFRQNHFGSLWFEDRANAVRARSSPGVHIKARLKVPHLVLRADHPIPTDQGACSSRVPAAARPPSRRCLPVTAEDIQTPIFNDTCSGADASTPPKCSRSHPVGSGIILRSPPTVSLKLR